jgi:hypothetical protein
MRAFKQNLKELRTEYIELQKERKALEILIK